MGAPDAKKILIVDDDPQVVEILQRFLETPDGAYVVRTASNGKEALASVNRDPPDLVLLDIAMPGMDGVEVLKRIAAINDNIAVMMVTANVDEAPGDALRLGAFAYLPKPLDLAYIEQLVPLALTQRRPPSKRRSRGAPNLAPIVPPPPPEPEPAPVRVTKLPSPVRCPSPVVEAMDAYERGQAAFRAHRWSEAAPAFERCTTLDPDNANGWHNLGRVLEHLGRWPDAMKAQDAACHAFARKGDEGGQGQCLRSMGNVHLALGSHAQALSHYEHALAIAEKTRDGSEQARNLGGIGNAHYAAGRSPEALTFYTRALTLAERLGDEAVQTRLLAALGTTHSSEGRIDEGLRYCERALTLAEKLGEEPLQASLLSAIGRAHLDEGREGEATDSLHRAAQIAGRLGDERTLAQTLFLIGVLRAKQGRWREALDHYDRAVVIADRLGMPEREGFRECRDQARSASPSA